MKVMHRRLQPHRDPRTATRSHVFSCFNQDQLLDSVDFPALTQRLKQDSLSEKLTGGVDPPPPGAVTRADATPSVAHTITTPSRPWHRSM